MILVCMKKDKGINVSWMKVPPLSYDGIASQRKDPLAPGFGGGDSQVTFAKLG